MGIVLDCKDPKGSAKKLREGRESMHVFRLSHNLCQQMRFFPRVTWSFDTLQVELQSKIQDVQIFNSVKSIHRLLSSGYLTNHS